jgi:superfamily II DNA or RNA helicase
LPNIFDNIDLHLLDELRSTLAEQATAADISVGYFNLRGWSRLGDRVDRFSGADDSCCRLLIGMQRAPEELMRESQRLHHDDYLDGPAIARMRRTAAQRFKEQIEFGVPTAAAETTLRQLAMQLRARKVRVKLFLRHTLHAKLYLIRHPDRKAPLIGYVGSSNLTFSGLQDQGELNVDVVESDAAQKLQMWFNDRWSDPLAYDISDDLAELIETSWASEKLVKPYHVYLKMAYHLCQEAREGEREFAVPDILREVLLDFQAEAVSLAAHYLHRRGGVLLGDVVGLGKTLMAIAIARIFQEDDNSNTLVICPPKLVPMWQWHIAQYRIAGAAMSLGSVIEDLERLPRYRLVVIDESHNLRNREGKRYAAIREYIERNDSRVLLLTATPYNKQYTDLSNQLRLFLDDQRDLRVRPEQYFQGWAAQGFNEADFMARFQASPRTLRAFEQSRFPDDWRDLMRLFLVRRTRQFIIRNYATFDEQRQRHFVTLNGQPSYFPVRQPKTLAFTLDEQDPHDQYARLYQASVVQVIEDLALPRYELAAYVNDAAAKSASATEKEQLENLARGGRRLIGFSRTNLFKRLESSGQSFLLSIERHILRNMVTLYALEQGKPIPIGTQDAALLDMSVTDVDDEVPASDEVADEQVANDEQRTLDASVPVDAGLSAYQARAAQVYQVYWTQFRRRFKWLDPKFFKPGLKRALKADAQALTSVLQQARAWRPDQDAKLAELHRLLIELHQREKVLVFTQFADTAEYLGEQLQRRGLRDMAVATGQAGDPTALARRFSPTTNGGLRPGENELRVLVATDVLGEGQNLQDAHIVVNYDLPWAIIRLIQRAGRVDRIGQQADTILAYSFVPAEGVERIIRLRKRLYQRLQQNQEVIGTDETFFGEDAENHLRDLYTERSSVLEDDADEDVDLASTALQVWNSASEADRKAAQQLAPIVAAARALDTGTVVTAGAPGAIIYLRFPDGTDAMVRVDRQGNLLSQSLAATFRAVACGPDTPALPKADDHHDLVAAALAAALQEQGTFSGQLGSLRSTRRQVYERLKRCREAHQRRPTLFSQPFLDGLPPTLDALLRYPLKDTARTALTRQLRLGIGDDGLADMVMRMYVEDRLITVTDTDDETPPDPQIVCSMGLLPTPADMGANP